MLASKSAVISCSKTAPVTSLTARTQTEMPFGGAAMNKVSTPPTAMAKGAPMSVRVGAPVPSFVTSCQLACVPRWKPIPTALITAASVRLNETLFPSLHHARATLAAWRTDYNTELPHSRLG